ncbi:ExeM/NucH family extracellular endonuclease [Luedemannella flava]|uniref:ExeM/NucH family extracellular endonuclease n=1 Tax=Luedemannella flava TaxID=349316 RepID=UPI0031DB1ADC
MTAALLAVSLAAVVVNASSAAADFGEGNLVVLRVGTGSAALSSAATEAFLDEYTPAGALVRTVALPTTGTGANRRLTVSGSATTEGALARSADGRYLTLGGYDADPGTASVAGTAAATTARVVARVDGAGVVDTSTALTDAYSGGNIRGAVTDDGSRFWTVGSAGGVRLAAAGASTSTQINSAAPVNLRVAGIVAGQLYVTTGSSPTGLYAVGAGLPTTGGQTPALAAAAPSPYGFAALDRDATVPGVDTLYVADDNGTAGGVLKFSFDGATWTARGAFRPGGAGARGITGAVTGSGATLFATTTTSGGQLVKVEDTAAFDATIAATSTVLATPPANTALRGVAFAPTPTTSGPTTAAPTTAEPTSAAPTTAEPTTGAPTTAPPTTAPTTTAPTTTAPPVPCTTAAVAIGSVQGAGDLSPVAGSSVTIRGTVVGDYEGASPALRGFYLQDAGDGLPATSDGVFVFNGSANVVAPGDVVQVTGTVSEFQGQTQLTAAVGGVEACGTTAPVTPVDITLPVTDLEPYEGMLVRVHQTLTVTEHFQLGRFGQVVVSSGGRLRQPTSDIRATDTAAVAAAQAANNRNRLIIDDATNGQNPDPIAFGRGGQPLSASNTLRGGDTVTDPVGVLTYTWAGNAASGNAYRLRPLGALGGAATFVAANERPTTPPDTGAGSVRVASANLLNFFTEFTNCRFGTQGAVTDCRGASDATEYQRQLAKEVASLRFLDADVIGYMEMQNNGYGPTSAVRALVDALNAADGPGTWAFVDADAATGVVDVAGTDAIKAGIIYRAAAVTPLAFGTFVNQDAIYERRPVAQAFTTPDGGRFTVVANHFKSKGSCPTSGPDTDQGDGQSCWNARRTTQATTLAGWLADTVVPAVGDPDVFIVGDLNSYAGEDPIAALEAAGYTNLVKAYHGDDAYSYVFDGQWGYLDYVLASASAVPQVTGAGDAHHNADEPSVLDYLTDFKSAGQITSLYAPDRFRTSDHDPVVVGFAPSVTRAATTTTLATSGSPSVLGAPVRFTATVAGPAGVPVAGTVQFTVDGRPFGAPVAVTGGVAGLETAALPAGTHTVTAAYSGSAALLASSATAVTQFVRYAVTITSPAAGASVRAGTTVPIRVTLADASGTPIPWVEGLVVGLTRVKVSASGAQTLPAVTPLYDPISRSYLVPWPTTRRPTGTVTIAVDVAYPGAATQRVTTTLTLS